MALQVAITNAAAGIPVLLVNFEESLIRLTLKAPCAKAGKEAKRFLDGFGNPADLESVAREYEASLAPLHLLQGNSRLTPVQVKAAALQLMRQFQQSCCLIIVDYLQSWTATRQNDKDFRLVVSSLMGELRAEEPLLTVKTLAKYLQVSEQWVYERVHLKEIPHLKVGKFPRFKRSDIDRWLDTLKIPVSNPLSSAIQPQGRGVNRRGA